jgi:hypothetical protein
VAGMTYSKLHNRTQALTMSLQGSEVANLHAALQRFFDNSVIAAGVDSPAIEEHLDIFEDFVF